MPLKACPYCEKKHSMRVACPEYKKFRDGESPLVSVIVPCRNEGAFLNGCLSSLVKNDYPKDRLEIIVVDGMSTDETWSIADYYRKTYPFVKMLPNLKRTTPNAMNIGIRHALRNDVRFVMRADAHSEYPPDYIASLAGSLNEAEGNVCNVGGRLNVATRRQNTVDKATLLARHAPFGPQRKEYYVPDLIMIAGAHSIYQKDYISKCADRSKFAENVGGTVQSKRDALTVARGDLFGCGNSPFRNNKRLRKGMVVDTVFGGCYRREVFEKIGLFNENLTRGQDLEFNLRLKRAGMETRLFPNIVTTYYPTTKFMPFLKKAFQDGKWITLAQKYAEGAVTFRHLVPMFFTLTLPVSILPYALLNLFRSFQLAGRMRSWRFLFLLPFIFFFMHTTYGIGSLWGLVLKAR